MLAFTRAGGWATFRAMLESNPPPALPEVFDEAGNSPRWLLALGIALLVVLAAVVAARFLGKRDDQVQPTAAPSTGDAAQVSAASGPQHV